MARWDWIILSVRWAGSTTQLANSTGSVTDSYLYDSFGNVLLDTAAANPFRYKGKFGYYLDAGDTLAVYLRARYYSPAIGGFYSRDPLYRANPARPYVYCDSNPVLYRDPSGLIVWLPILIGVAVAAAWAGVCEAIALRTSTTTFNDDKQKHCMGACVFNRCTGLIFPAVTLLGSYLWELGGGWISPDSDEDLIADAWGIMQSYNVFSSCQSLCKDCRAVLMIPPPSLPPGPPPKRAPFDLPPWAGGGQK